MINQIKKLIGIKTIAQQADISERQAYNLVNSWKDKISKRDVHLLQSAIDEKIEELTDLSNKILNS